MNKATDVEILVNTLKAQGISKAEIIRRLADSCVGWPYVYAAAGEMCTPEWRKNRMGYSDEKYSAAIKNACPVLNGTKKQEIGYAAVYDDSGVIGQRADAVKTSSCSGCKWDGVRCFDCRGFTRWLLAQVGITLAGGGATSQWDTASNWVAKGEIKTMPKGLVCCVFKRKDGKMSHTGMAMGDGNGGIIHCSTTVKTGNAFTDTPAWTHWAIPAGLYSTDELRKAGLNVDETKNNPTLRRGSNGEAVEELQAILNAKYGAELEVDGVFGTKTEKAVKAFQNAHNLSADGIVGPKTWAALGIRTNSAVGNDNNAIDGENTAFDNTNSAIDHRKYIWDTLYNTLGNAYGVAGLMGNLQAESSLISNNLQSTGNRALGMDDESYTAKVDSGEYSAEQFAEDGYGYGLAQWTYSTRKKKLLEFARAQGASIGNLEMQLRFLLSELSTYSRVLSVLKSAASVREASDAVMISYEKPANQSEENQIRRAKLGQSFFDEYAASDDAEPEHIRNPTDGPKAALKAAYAALKMAMDYVQNALAELEE